MAFALKFFKDYTSKIQVRHHSRPYAILSAVESYTLSLVSLISSKVFMRKYLHKIAYILTSYIHYFTKWPTGSSLSIVLK